MPISPYPVEKDFFPLRCAQPPGTEGRKKQSSQDQEMLCTEPTPA